MAWVHGLIKDAIDKGLGGIMVLPNVMKVNWADPDDDGTVSFQNLLPAHTIRLGIIEARELRAESGMLHQRRDPDVFAGIVVANQKVVTRTIGKAQNPVWGEEFDVLVYDMRQFIGGVVYDVDFAGRSKPIGTLKQVPIASVVSHGEEGVWIDLIDTPSGIESAILIKATLFDLQSDAKHLRECIGNDVETDIDLDKLAQTSPSQRSNGIGSLGLEESPVLEDEEVVPGIGGMLGCDSAPEIEQTSAHAGAVALLICDIAGGHIPKGLCEHRAQVDVKIHTDAGVRNGKLKATERCAELEAIASATIGEKAAKTIQRLADGGMKADAIAQALEEDEMEVHRIIRRRGWNMNVPQKLCIFLHQNDLEGAKYIDISLHLKKKRIAKGSMPIRHVLSHFHMKHSEIVKCLSESKGMLLISMPSSVSTR